MADRPPCGIATSMRSISIPLDLAARAACRMLRRLRLPALRVVRSAFAVAIACAAPVALAAFDSFVLDELYSNADGTIQYVVLREAQGLDGGHLLRGRTLAATHAGVTRTYVFTHDLPSTATAGRRVLLATRSFHLASSIVPDYVIPTRFLAVDGGSVDFAGVNALTYAALPGDGRLALRRGGAIAPGVAINFAGETAALSPLPITVVEFVNPSLDHYFVSPLAPDIDALDSGRIAGWTRSGQTFLAYPINTGGTASPVCRFYIPPQHGNSHFFSAYPPECAQVEGKIGTDPNYSGYVYESREAFDTLLPNLATGACPVNSTPVFRLWNARADSNHRYAVDPAIRAQMLARHYVAEGFGADGVGMCALTVPDSAAPVLVNGGSPFVANCDGAAASGALYFAAEVEPSVAVDPRNAKHLVGLWQQDRWSNGGSRGLVAGVSRDGGKTWSRTLPSFSRCSGGNAQNGADYERASDPWVTFTPDSKVFAIALSFSGGEMVAGSSSAILVSRSIDGGATWGNPATLIRDGEQFFNDKESITADPTDARYVYAAWDRGTADNRGPAYFSRTTDGGASWEPAVAIYDPGTGRQTLGNQIAVLPDGTLLYFHTFLDNRTAAPLPARLALLRSTDKGTTWSGPLAIANVQALGATDPVTHAPVRDGAEIGSIAVGPDGRIAVVWQDARFSGGARDGIAFSQSRDGGSTWTTPVSINGNLAVQAFTPTVHIRDDGTIGVSYYDMRPLLPSGNGTLPVDYWLAQSNDGATWRESLIAGPFDLASAPNAGGYFLGDYQALTSISDVFIPFFVATTGDVNNRNDVFAARLAGAGAVAGTAATAKSATVPAASTAVASVASDDLPLTPELAQRLRDAVARVVAVRRARGQPSTAVPGE